MTGHDPGDRCPWPKRCTCTHEDCEQGWIEAHRIDPADGAVRLMVAKCPRCLGIDPEDPPYIETTPTGETYTDRKARAAG